MEISASLAGDLQLTRLFAELPGRVQTRVMRPVLAEGSRMAAAAVRSESPRESGLTKLAAGASSTRSYSGGSKLFVAVGIRRGFRRPVTAKVRGGLKYSRSGEGNFRDPVRYAATVQVGRKAVSARPGSVLFDKYTGRCFGKHVAAAAPNPFIARAFAGSQSSIFATLSERFGQLTIAEAKTLM